MNNLAMVIGATIVKVREMTKAEARAEGWDNSSHVATVLVLSNGCKLYASRDDEGNGPGAMFGEYKKDKFAL